MKKVIAILLALSMALSICVFAGAETDNNAEQKLLYREKSFLKSLDIPEISILDKNEITRAEFTALVINALYPDKIFEGMDGNKVFNDVDSDHRYYSEIKGAKDLGIINGRSNAMFNPDSQITLNDAIVILVNALGHTAYANVNGGYVSGYYITAKQIGLLKDVGTSAEFSSVTAAKLLYNALFIDVALVDSIESDGINISIKPDSDLLSSVYGIKKYIATVIANPLSSVTGDGLSGEEFAVIRDDTGNKYTVYTNNTGIEWLLGRKLTVYVKNNELTGRNEVIHYLPYHKSDMLSIKTDTIINVTADYIEYEEGDEIRKAKTAGAYVLYNGVFQNTYNNSIFRPADGIITFVNNDNDSEYEVIDILSFNYKRTDSQTTIAHNLSARNIVVDSVNVDKEYIVCKWNPQNNINLDSEKTVYRIVSDDEEIKTIADIKENDVISVAQAPEKCSGKEFYTLAVTREKVTDIVYGENAKEYKVDINGVDYTVSSSVYSVRKNYTTNLQFGKDVTVLLDYTGKIAYFDKLHNIDNNFAYLISAKVNTNPDSVLTVKIFDSSNSVNVYKVAANALIDGVSYKNEANTANKQLEALEKRPANYGKMINSETGLPYETSISRPVIVKKNSDGIITSINTDNPDYPLISPGQINLYSDYNGIGYSDEEIDDNDTLKAGHRSHRLSGYRASASTVDGMFFVNSLTYVIKVPDIDTCGLDDVNPYLSNPNNTTNGKVIYDVLKFHEMEKTDANYKLIKASELRGDIAYDIQGYNIDPDTGVAEFVVLRGIDGVAQSVDYQEGFSIFLKMTESYDSALEKNVKKLYYTNDGITELSVLVDCDNLFYAYNYIINGAAKTDENNITGADIAPLKRGDIIRVGETSGYLSHIERVYRTEDIDNAMASTRFPSAAVGYKKAQSYDVYTSWYANTASYGLATVVPKYVKGGILCGVQGFKTPASIDLSNPSTYVNQFVDVSALTPMVVEINSDTDIKIYSGSFADVITLEETNGVLKGASRVIYMQEDFILESIVIINDRR